MQACFYMELPNNTVFPPEVEQILRHSMGFFWAKDRPDLPWVRRCWKDMVKWNPLQKVYLYRDEESAATDMAFILFDVWKFPVDSPLYVKAASFGTDHRFENGNESSDSWTHGASIMANDWFVKIDNKVESGPISSDTLKQLALEGRIKPDTPLKKGPSGSWVTANHVKGLFPISPLSALSPGIAG